MSKEKRGTVWSIPVTNEMDSQVERAVESGSYVTKSEAVRESVRRNPVFGGAK